MLLRILLISSLMICLIYLSSSKQERFTDLPQTFERRVEQLCEKGWLVLKKPGYSDIASCTQSPSMQAMKANDMLKPLLMNDVTYQTILKGLDDSVKGALPAKYEDRVDMTCDIGYRSMNDDVAYTSADECKQSSQTNLMKTDGIARSSMMPQLMDDTYMICAVSAYGQKDADALANCSSTWETRFAQSGM